LPTITEIPNTGLNEWKPNNLIPKTVCFCFSLETEFKKTEKSEECLTSEEAFRSTVFWALAQGERKQPATHTDTDQSKPLC